MIEEMIHTSASSQYIHNRLEVKMVEIPSHSKMEMRKKLNFPPKLLISMSKSKVCIIFHPEQHSDHILIPT